MIIDIYDGAEFVERGKADNARCADVRCRFLDTINHQEMGTHKWIEYKEMK